MFVLSLSLNLIGKKEIWEQSMNNTSSVFYLENENVVELNKFKSPWILFLFKNYYDNLYFL